jgi:hypothetical protein
MKRPAFQFYPGDWRKDPCLARCSPATRGVWLDLLCAIHNLDDRGAITGTIDQLARATGCFPTDMEPALAELEATNTADVTKSEGVVTVVSRRFKREWHERNGAKLRKQKQRFGCVEIDVTPESRQGYTPSSSSSSSSSSDQNLPHAYARDAGAPPTGPGHQRPTCDPAKLQQAWTRITGVMAHNGLLELAATVEATAGSHDPPVLPDEYAERCIRAFVAWVDGIDNERRRPQKSPRKLIDNFERIQEIVDGKRAAVPAEEPPPKGRFSSPADVRLQPPGLAEIEANSAKLRAIAPVEEPRPYGPASAKGARSRP